MAKAIEVNNFHQVIGSYPNVKQALKAVEVFSGCSMADDTKPHQVNRILNNDGYAFVKNCFDVQFELKLV